MYIIESFESIIQNVPTSRSKWHPPFNNRSTLKGWFSKNTSCVYMKEFFELIQMVYATYSNSSPIARNLKIKNWKSKIVPLGWRFCDPWVDVLAARGWRFGGRGLAFWRPGVGVSATRSNWLNYFGQSKRVAETSTPMSRNRQPPCRGIANPHVARTSTQGHYFLIFWSVFFNFLAVGAELE